MAVLAHEVRLAPSVPAVPPSVHRVLVAFDGSPAAWVALRQGIAVAAEQRALLTIAGVIDDRGTAWIGLSPIALPCSRESLRRDAEREMQRQLAAARDEVPATVSVTTRILRGRTIPALAQLADAGCYDLVVTGPRRSGRLRRLLGGSVTHGLLDRSRASVLAVRAT